MKTYGVIIAGGKGCRTKNDYPKCGLTLLGKSMIEYIIDAMQKSKIDEIIAVVGHKHEIIESIVGNKAKCVYQKEQLGTANAVSCCESIIDNQGRTIIVAGDTPLIDEKVISELIVTHENNNNVLTVTTIKTDNPKEFGRIIRDKNGDLLRIREAKDASKDELLVNEVNASLYCVDNKALFKALKLVDCDNAKKEYYLTDIVSIIRQWSKVGTYICSDSYKLMGIDDLATLATVEEQMRKRKNAALLNYGVRLVNADSIMIGTEVKIGKGTVIYPNSHLLGQTVVGENAVIGPGTELVDTIVGDYSTVKLSTIENSQIGKNTDVGPYAHLRNQSIIGDNCRIGNYVEIKNSLIGNNVKVAHLTYIGDTTCGNNVNWGCGTVTVNYDGKNKYRTVIGNDVFIGCNSNLIAPITIEDDAFIAAGSTITKGIEKGDFVIARTQQVTKKKYAMKYKKA